MALKLLLRLFLDIFNGTFLVTTASPLLAAAAAPPWTPKIMPFLKASIVFPFIWQGTAEA